jgi:anaerobic ribonucleoside-triphosphate reductase activating protein
MSEVRLGQQEFSKFEKSLCPSRTSLDIYVGYYSWPIYVLGPGKRVGLWLQGCTLNCPGCMSPHLFVQREENKMAVAALMEKLQIGLSSCDGVTISGGEPFEQPQALCALLQQIAPFRHLDVMVYSGFTIEEIWQDSDKREALRWIDMLMDGRFDVKASNHKIWRGSDNQRLLLLSERAQKYAEFCEARMNGQRAMQVEMTEAGDLRVYGIPERGALRKVEKKLQEIGVFWTKRSRTCATGFAEREISLCASSTSLRTSSTLVMQQEIFPCVE